MPYAAADISITGVGGKKKRKGCGPKNKTKENNNNGRVGCVAAVNEGELHSP